MTHGWILDLNPYYRKADKTQGKVEFNYVRKIIPQNYF